MLVAGWDKKKGREGMPRFKTSLQTATLSSLATRTPTMAAFFVYGAGAGATGS